jgi:RNA polymerase sigma-70 factor (ECF subfamily)
MMMVRTGQWMMAGSNKLLILVLDYVTANSKPVHLPAISTLNEKDMLSRLREGDEMALTALYKAHWKSLFLSAYTVIKDKEVCEDIVQDLFYKYGEKGNAGNKRVAPCISFCSSPLPGFSLYPESIEIQYHPCDITPDQVLPSDEKILKNELRIRITWQYPVCLKMPSIYKLSREQQLSHREIGCCSVSQQRL